MNTKLLRIISFCLCSLLAISAFAQTGKISGKVISNNEDLGFASVQIKGTKLGTTTDENGKFEIENIPFGDYTIQATFVGYQSASKNVALTEANPTLQLNFNLKEEMSQLEQVVITGTRTSKKITDSPIMVNLIDSKTLTNTQSCNLSEGLKFQPGLRVETDCQTCNYTQLRMNGLGGGYSQILINGRPIFSPLTGLYGMEQIPTNMIERIEIVRGGGSALYGSSAIGGTVNVITKIPSENGYDIGYTHQNIDGASDHIISGNASALNHNGNAGVTLFVNKRRRDMYDANGDNFSELPELENNSFGANMFFQPKENQKLEVNFSSLNEYRYGGEMVDKAAHLALQSEERTHNVLIGSIDYQINFNNDNSSLITYFGAQNTTREHYTGIFPDDPTAIENHLADPPYGTSNNTTLQGGVQLNHRLKDFLGGSNVLTLGSEYVTDDVLDVIEAYDYKIDQRTEDLGVFLQSDWEILPSLDLLSGLRVDKHNLVDELIASPRFSLLYKLRSTTQFRLTWGTGFRAPQAFDTDLHIAFAGGGVSRISLADDLTHERSNSLSGSVNFDKATENYIYGFTVEGFYTKLDDAFYLHPLGEDQFGERFEKRNGAGATVQGVTIETRANYREMIQLEAGLTLQTSLYNEPVENIEGLEAKREFLRTPNDYGYATLTITPQDQFSTSVNLVYTGAMELVHFAGAPEQSEDAYITSSTFTEVSLRSGYTIPLEKLNTGLEIFGGIKNITNAYQQDFDSGKNRDSNYVYGPAAPRTYFFGVRVKSF